MINLKYAKAILNTLFHTSGSAGRTPAQEQSMIINAGVPLTGYTAQQYFDAYEDDGYTSDGEATEALNAKKRTADTLGLTWFYTKYTTSETFEYTAPGTTVKKTVSLRGWTIEQYAEQKQYYPGTSYLALYTTMPDANGANYVEPSADAYMRVNLHCGIISGDVDINKAYKDEETGEAVVDNCAVIAFPEVYGADWGTIVGFGVHTSGVAGDTDVPVFWGRLSSPIVSQLNHVPLFRVGNFKVTLQ